MKNVSLLRMAGCAIACFTLMACNKKFDPSSGAPPTAKVEEIGDTGVVTVDKPEQFPLVAADRMETAIELKVTGSVNPDVSREVPVISLARRPDLLHAAGAGAVQLSVSRRCKGVAQPIHGLAYRSLQTGCRVRHRTSLSDRGSACLVLALSAYLAFSGVIGSEFLPHLDEGAIWVRGTLAPSTGPHESLAIANQARVVLAQFPEVIETTSQIGRADDGTDTTGYFNTEYYVGLKPKEDWRPVFHQNKEDLIASMDEQLEKIPGVIWNFSQPISDNVEEAVSGVKGELAVEIYGDDLKTLEAKGNQIVSILGKIPGIQDLGLFRVIGQPNLTFTVDRTAAARYGINVADVQDAVQTAVGGNAVSQVLQQEARYDLVLRYQQPYRDTREAIENIRLLSSSGERVSLAQLTKVTITDGAEEIYREGEQRYIAVKYSVRGRDLGSTVEGAIDRVNKQVSLPPGYHIDWAGEYESQKRSQKRLLLVLPITMLLIFGILYTMFRSGKWAALIMANVAMAPVGGLLALLITHTNFSVSSGVGFLALFGVSVQTGVIMLEYINQLRVLGHTIEEAAISGAVLRLRPIMMTMLVATLGLLRAATSHGIGSDSQRPFAIVIVGGLVGALAINVFLLPTLYVWIAGPRDVLPVPDTEFED